MDESGHKAIELLVDKGSKFYNRSMKSWLQYNDIEICSALNKGKPIAPERFIRAFKNKIYKCMTSSLKNVYIDKLGDTLNTKIRIIAQSK